MKLETPLLDEFCAVTHAAGTEIWFTVRLPSGESKQMDVNALFRELHHAVHALHHFMDVDGEHHPDFKVQGLKPYRPADNGTNPDGAAIGYP